MRFDVLISGGSEAGLVRCWARRATQVQLSVGFSHHGAPVPSKSWTAA
jgi:hypothetical protein